jgi:hypothetical protein
VSADELAWAPTACTLPTADRPIRVAEFDDLFRRSLLGQQRLNPTRLRWRFESGSEATARGLADRESSCCPFFTFTFTVAGDQNGLQVDVEVPSEQVEVLDALEQRAAAGMTP